MKIELTLFAFLCIVILANCNRALDQNKSASMHSDNQTRQRHEIIYRRWQNVTNAMPPFSKTTAYTSLPEFSSIVACGEEILPFLREKIRKDEGMDFILSIAVIKIMNWPEEQFPTTDMTQLRQNVLQRLDASGDH